jgi:hypothetical protein
MSTAFAVAMCLVAGAFALILKEGSAAAHSWTKYTTGSPPALAGNRAKGTSSTPTLIPLAVQYTTSSNPEYIWALSSTTTGCNSGDSQLYLSAFGGAFTQEKDTSSNPVCLRGVVQDAGTSAMAFGWQTNGNVWDRNGGGGEWHHESNLDGNTSLAIYDYASVLHGTSNSSSCTTSGVPHGGCLQEFNTTTWPSGSWATWSNGWGGAMMSMDNDSGGDLIVLGSGGAAWGFTIFGSGEASTTACNGTSLDFDAVAVDGVTGAFGLDTSGNIWFQATCSDNSTKWNELPTKTGGFDSVVADDSASNGKFVWATYSGDIYWSN